MINRHSPFLKRKPKLMTRILEKIYFFITFPSAGEGN